MTLIALSWEIATPAQHEQPRVGMSKYEPVSVVYNLPQQLHQHVETPYLPAGGHRWIHVDSGAASGYPTGTTELLKSLSLGVYIITSDHG